MLVIRAVVAVVLLIRRSLVVAVAVMEAHQVAVVLAVGKLD